MSHRCQQSRSQVTVTPCVSNDVHGNYIEVKCNDKCGKFYVGIYHKATGKHAPKCILVDDTRWLSTTDFEGFAGRSMHASQKMESYYSVC